MVLIVATSTVAGALGGVGAAASAIGGAGAAITVDGQAGADDNQAGQNGWVAYARTGPRRRSGRRGSGSVRSRGKRTRYAHPEHFY